MYEDHLSSYELCNRVLLLISGLPVYSDYTYRELLKRTIQPPSTICDFILIRVRLQHRLETLQSFRMFVSFFNNCEGVVYALQIPVFLLAVLVRMHNSYERAVLLQWMYQPCDVSQLTELRTR
jgi:hypothetical protein